MKFMTAEQINVKLIALIKNERKLTEEILNHIILFQKCSGYLKLGYSTMHQYMTRTLGYSTMHQYMTRTLGYSDDQAYRRLKAAKLLQDIPDVADQLKSGEINLSQAAQTQQAIETSQKETKNPVSDEKKKKIINAIKKSNNFDTKKTLASELNLKPKLDEKLIPQSNKTVRLEINLTQEQFEKLKNIKSRLSHKVPSQNTSEVLEFLFDQYLNKNSISKKPKVQENSTTLVMKQSNAESAITREFKVQNNSTLSGTANDFSDSPNADSLIIMNQSLPNTEAIITGCFMENGDQSKNHLNTNITNDTNNGNINPISNSNNTKTKEAMKSQKSKKTNSTNQNSFKRTRYIPLHIRRTVFQRANHCCEFTGSNKERCASRYQLEMDHFIKPYSQGGDHSLDNLKLHCSKHNLYRASRIGIGIETIKSNF